ncbi:hypothetical protein B0T36_18280 [Nocardia donostiensis]|uniref:hypothetical protein n=1 Tax=Nocardia donostiensis TaxID=1538463 RepID=UPI0009DA7F7B|nr:hypothetical protein [Nocardia donostiensis]OQS13679.1 hypothetical protein B0T36_18280 [Nocardia donostiensis]
MADNEFGYTAWGMGWVRLAEPLRQTRPDPLLPRARSIARNNGVRAEIEGHIVRAHIHRSGQASVTHLELAPLPRTAITTIAKVLTPEPPILTDEMHRAVVDAGVDPAPALAAADCSCSARTSRCVHVLATLYEMARRVDENPRLSLDAQGYGSTLPGDEDEGPAPEQARWTPINTLDTVTYFTAPAG